MKYRNSLAYVQRQNDDLLRKFQIFVRIYIDDIVIFSKILNEYIRYLDEMFRLFEKLNIALKVFKTYLSYSFISFLDQKIDILDLIIAKNKLVAITNLSFLKILKNLNIYLDMIE